MSPSLYVCLRVSPVMCVTRACFQVYQMVMESGTFIYDSLCLYPRRVYVCVGLSVTVHL